MSNKPISAAYGRAFRLFLKHTDQKTRARKWLEKHVARLPSRRVFIDVGAGEGTLTAVFARKFARTIAIEPNPRLRSALTTIDGIEIRSTKIDGIKNPPFADLILCSHVLYLLDPPSWLRHIRRMISWLSASGSLVIVNQSRETDCRRMVRHFFGRSPHISSIYRHLSSLEVKGFQVHIKRIPSTAVAPNIDVGQSLAAFFLMGKHGPLPPEAEIREYLEKHCRNSFGEYRLSCDQDLILISRMNGLTKGWCRGGPIIR